MIFIEKTDNFNRLQEEAHVYCCFPDWIFPDWIAHCLECSSSFSMSMGFIPEEVDTIVTGFRHRLLCCSDKGITNWQERNADRGRRA